VILNALLIDLEVPFKFQSVMMPPTRLLLPCIVITLLTIIGIVNCLYTTQASQTPSSSPQTNPHKAQVIGGRWQHIQASLGIDPLPDAVSLPYHISTPRPPSRIGFRRKKRVPPAPLHFAHDALHVPKVSLGELVVSLRRIAHEETRMEVSRSDNKKSRAKVGRSPTGIRQRHVSTRH
jgi:hypothetical protein